MKVERSVVLEAGVDDVWAAVTDPCHLADWFADDVAIDVSIGGRATWTDDGGDERWGSVEVVEPPRRLVVRWRSRRTVRGGKLAFDLVPLDGGTRLTVTESEGTDPGEGSGPGRVLAHA